MYMYMYICVYVYIHGHIYQYYVPLFPENGSIFSYLLSFLH